MQPGKTRRCLLHSRSFLMPAGLSRLLSLLPPPTHDGVTLRRQWPNSDGRYLAQTGHPPLGAGCVRVGGGHMVLSLTPARSGITSWEAGKPPPTWKGVVTLIHCPLFGQQYCGPERFDNSPSIPQQSGNRAETWPWVS